MGTETMQAERSHKSARGQAARMAGWLVAVCMCVSGAAAQAVSSDSAQAIADAEHALSAQDFSRALRVLDAEVKAHPQDYRLWTLEGMAYAGAHDADSALKAYRAALARRADYLPALEGAAQIEFDRNRPDAGTLLKRAAEIRPDEPTTNAMLGVLAFRKGDCKQAVVRFGTASRVIDSQLAALSEYGFCLARLERYGEAAGVLERAAALDPGLRSRYNLALVEWKAKRYDDALSTLSPDLAAPAPEEKVLTLAAAIHEAKNDTPEAVDVLRKAIALHPQESEAYLAFATIANDHASYQVGIDMLNAGIARLPKEASLYLARGVLNAQKGELDRATDDFQSANRIDPRMSFSGTAEGIAEAQRHDPEKALTTLRAEARQHPDNAFDQYMIAETIAQMGPGDGSALYAEELRSARRAVRLDPHMAVAHNLLGSAFLESGDYPHAIEESRSVLQFDSDNQEALYHLILALKKTNQSAEIAALTQRLIKLRNADRDAKSHMIRYELVETAAATPSP